MTLGGGKEDKEEDRKEGDGRSKEEEEEERREGNEKGLPCKGREKQRLGQGGVGPALGGAATPGFYEQGRRIGVHLRLDHVSNRERE
ncbi:hypothetical protein M5K25_013468 [Dendrobium thyrsiflorum]|uniref:Uncharacterized protein n=1 Tax=Dendrobium thyrsiflorum TaxID=117978 RepID=A0ABD0UT41_DENTH